MPKLAEKVWNVIKEANLNSMEVNAKSFTHEGKDLQDGTMYRQLIRNLI